LSDATAPNQSGTPAPGPPPMQLVYANVMGMRGGAFDLSLEFGYAIPPGEGEEPQPPAWSTRVAMSWEHARALYTLLGENLKQYEDQVGAIPNIAVLRKAGEGS
jgi:hypothetical protein